MTNDFPRPLAAVLHFLEQPENAWLPGVDAEITHLKRMQRVTERSLNLMTLQPLFAAMIAGTIIFGEQFHRTANDAWRFPDKTELIFVVFYLLVTDIPNGTWYWRGVRFVKKGKSLSAHSIYADPAEV